MKQRTKTKLTLMSASVVAIVLSLSPQFAAAADQLSSGTTRRYEAYATSEETGRQISVHLIGGAESEDLLAYCFNRGRVVPNASLNSKVNVVASPYDILENPTNEVFLQYTDNPRTAETPNPNKLDSGFTQEEFRQRILNVVWNGYPYDQAHLLSKISQQWDKPIASRSGSSTLKDLAKTFAQTPDQYYYYWLTQRAIWYYTDGLVYDKNSSNNFWRNTSVEREYFETLIKNAANPQKAAPEKFVLDLFVTDKRVDGTLEKPKQVKDPITGEYRLDTEFLFQNLLVIRDVLDSEVQKELDKAKEGSGSEGDSDKDKEQGEKEAKEEIKRPEMQKETSKAAEGIQGDDGKTAEQTKQNSDLQKQSPQTSNSAPALSSTGSCIGILLAIALSLTALGIVLKHTRRNI